MKLFVFAVFLALFTFAFGQSPQREVKVLAFAGSTRTDSLNKKLVSEAAEMAREMGAQVTVIDLKEFPLPLYDEDIKKEGTPENAKKLRQMMLEADAFLIASPEYNHSVSGVLKNVLDWATFTEQGAFSREAFEGKSIGIMSASPGKSGGAKGLIHLKDILEELHGFVIPLQVSVARAHEVAVSKEGFKISTIQEPIKAEVAQLLQTEKKRS